MAFAIEGRRDGYGSRCCSPRAGCANRNHIGIEADARLLSWLSPLHKAKTTLLRHITRYAVLRASYAISWRRESMARGDGRDAAAMKRRLRA